MGSRGVEAEAYSRAWRLDGLLAGALLIGLWHLQPVMPDGDGLAHALRAIYSTYLDGIDIKHPLYAALLRAVYQLSVAGGLRTHTITLLSLSSHLAAVGIFLLLARSLYPLVMNKTIASLSAAGAVFSFGLLSRGSTIEAYAPALCADIALLAFIIKAKLRPLAFGFIAGVFFIVALGFHVTNVLMGPLVIVLLVYCVGRDQAVPTVVVFGATVSVGLAIFVTGLLLARGLSLWPPDLLAVTPTGDPQPPMTVAARLGRALYGMAKTVAYLPPVRELTPAFSLTYIAAAGTVGLSLLYFARHGLWRRLNSYVQLLTLLTIGGMPFIVMGVYYFPSDPERWLFLLPVVWLVIGVIIDSSGQLRLRTGIQAPVAYFAIFVGCLAMYNAYQLIPQTKMNRDLSGLRELAKRVSPDDLVISPAGVNSRIYEFFIAPYPSFRNLTITALVERFGGDRHALETELRKQIDETFERGHRVYVHRVLNEGHRKGENYPWAHFTQFDYGPDTFITMLQQFTLMPVVLPTADSTGTFEIVETHVSIAK